MIITIWSLCLLATFAVGLGYGVRQKIILVKRLEERDKLHFIAEAGVKQGITELMKDDEEDEAYDYLGDDWSGSVSLFRDVVIDGGKYSVGYNCVNELTGLSEFRYGLIDEERKININKIDMHTIERLLKIIGLNEMEAQELSASIVDWRDEDNQMSIPIGSGEDFYYRGLRYSYEAKDADFEVLEELLLVRGMTRNIFGKIKNYITIYGDGKVNINTAPKEVLLALGLDSDLVDKIISFRYGHDGETYTEDDNAFTATHEIMPKLSQFTPLTDGEISQLSVVIDKYITTESHYFMIESIGTLLDRKAAAHITAVVSRNGKILYWEES